MFTARCCTSFGEKVHYKNASYKMLVNKLRSETSLSQDVHLNTVELIFEKSKQGDNTGLKRRGKWGKEKNVKI